jgi:putative Holliday junction resolvase
VTPDMSIRKRILGIDYGTRRIGVAVSDPLRLIATGVAVIENSPLAVAEIRQIAARYDPEKIVVGMPFTLKGEKGSSASEVEKFIARLEEELGLEIVRTDERFTSKVAQRTLRDMNVKKKERQVKGTIDMMSAALILQAYLDTGDR